MPSRTAQRFFGKEALFQKVKNGTYLKKIIIAKDAVVATNSPVSDFTAVHPKQSAYRTFVIGFEIKKGSIEHALYWDTESPYHYIRIVEDGDRDIIIIGGEDVKTGQDDKNEMRFDILEKWSKQHFKSLGKINYKWSGAGFRPRRRIKFHR